MSAPCEDCGGHHPLGLPPGLGGMLSKLLGGGTPVMVPLPFGPPPNPNTAFLRAPMQLKSRPLTSGELRIRFHGDGKRAHHKACRLLVSPDLLLDYVSCGKCNVALGEDDVFWKGYQPKRKKKKKKRRKK